MYIYTSWEQIGDWKSGTGNWELVTLFTVDISMTAFFLYRISVAASCKDHPMVHVATCECQLTKATDFVIYIHSIHMYICINTHTHTHTTRTYLQMVSVTPYLYLTPFFWMMDAMHADG